MRIGTLQINLQTFKNFTNNSFIYLYAYEYYIDNKNNYIKA